jgi:hypothetical protein
MMVEEKGIVPIVQKFLQPNYLFALEFKKGFVFGRVVRRRICQYKPYSVIDSNGATVNISANSHQAELRFRDPRNTENDILYLDSATSRDGYPWFMHGSFGIKPQQIYMYLRIPETKEIPGKFPNVDPIKPTSGDSLGYINSLNSPYEEPTDYMEVIIPPKIHISAEYYNKDPALAYNPVLNILFCVYWFQTLNRAKHASLIRAIALRTVPAAFLTVGVGDEPMELGSDLKEDWKAEIYSLDEASELR